MIPTPDEILSIYDGIESLPLSEDLQGWNSTGGIFADSISRTLPRVIIEVGSWKGASAIHMARLCRRLGLKTIIYAVDCWLPPIGVGLGEIPKTHIPDRFNAPTFYQQFLFNVKKSGFADMIIPVRGLTVCCSWLLQAWGIKAQVIYVDASHTEEAAYGDIESYWPLLDNGGIICGDDFAPHHPGVGRAVKRFASQKGKQITEWPAAEGTQWSLNPK